MGNNIYILRTLFAISMCYQRGVPIYGLHGVPTHILYLYDQM